MKKICKNIIPAITLFVISSGQTMAQVNFSVNVPNSAKGPTTSDLVSNVVTTLSFIAGVACVIAIIIGGIMYITSAGDENRVRSAKNTLLYAIIGIIISLSAYAIATFVVTQIQ